jgi:hypothetical protein
MSASQGAAKSATSEVDNVASLDDKGDQNATATQPKGEPPPRQDLRDVLRSMSMPRTIDVEPARKDWKKRPS